MPPTPLDQDVGNHPGDAIGEVLAVALADDCACRSVACDSSAIASTWARSTAFVEERRERCRVGAGGERLLHAQEERADSVGLLRSGGKAHHDTMTMRNPAQVRMATGPVRRTGKRD